MGWASVSMDGTTGQSEGYLVDYPSSITDTFRCTASLENARTGQNLP